MTTPKDLIEMSGKLEAIVADDGKQKSTQVLEILNVLKVLNIDPFLIRNAEIILTVNNLRKSMNNEEVVKVSKNLLRSWKKSVIVENNALKSYITNGSHPINETQEEKERRRRAKTRLESLLKMGTNSNKIRIKSRELLLKALLSGGDIEEDMFKFVRLAIEIEKYIFQEFQNTGHKYKVRVRSRVANLRDDQNTELKAKVLDGTIKEEEIARMSVEDMASDSLKQLRQLYHEESMIANTLPEVYGTTSDLLKCPECKKNTCAYNQVQIDRADEPMTTFCYCVSCGHRWRFD